MSRVLFARCSIVNRWHILREHMQIYNFRGIKMLKRFSYLVSSRFVYFSPEIISASSLVRLLHKANCQNTGSDEEDKKKQFTGPVPIEHLKIKYSRSPGPGGQNVNKVNTKVDLRFHVMTAQWLPYWIKEKLLEKEANRINKEGEFVVQSSRFRSQQKNLEDSIQKLQEILEEVSHIPKEPSQEKKDRISKLIKLDRERRLLDKKYRARRKQERSRNE